MQESKTTKTTKLAKKNLRIEFIAKTDVPEEIEFIRGCSDLLLSLISWMDGRIWWDSSFQAILIHVSNEWYAQALFLESEKHPIQSKHRWIAFGHVSDDQEYEAYW